MFSFRPFLIRSMRLTGSIALLALIASALVAAPANAHDESEFDVIYAPFECGSEWVAPFGAHHSHPWNLDFNRTSLNWGENRQHDLGQPLFAQGEGTVVRIAVHHNAGTYVDIDYGDYTVSYVHLVHGSVADGLAVGSTVTTGQFFALVGDTGNATGFAHLHIEYFDSRGFEDATSWELKQAGQPQTEVTFNGNSVDYDEVIVSQNCFGDAAGFPDPADGEIGVLANPNTRLDQLIERLQAATEATDGSADYESYLHETENGVNVFARIPGTDLADETVLISTSYTSPHDCAPEEAEEPLECPGASEHAASTLLALDLADALAAAETPPRRTILFAFWDEYDTVGGAADAFSADEANTLDDDVVVVVDYAIQGANAVLPLRRTTTAALHHREWRGLTDRFEDYQTPDLTRFTNRTLARRTADALTDMGVPVIAFTDVPGPCIGTAADTAAQAVDPDKLEAQTGEAIAFVEDLAADDVITDPAIGDSRVDAAALLELVARAGYSGEAYDELQAALDIPDEPVGGTLDAAVEQFLAELAAEPCASHTPSAPFTDINAASYARVDIALIHDLAITTGTSPTTYSPADSVTREQMAAFLGRLWRLYHPDAEPTAEMPFGDVAESSFAYDDIRLLVELELTTGTSPTTYSPGDAVTREQMAAFIGRLWRALHPEHDPDVVPGHSFIDVHDESFADDDISLIAWLGITTGTSATTYGPTDFVTREQMAAFLARFIRAVFDGEPIPTPDVPPVEPAEG